MAGDALMVPAVVVAVGSALVWHDTPRGASSRAPTDPFERLMSGRLSAPRVIGGIVLIATGLATLASEGKLSSVPRSAAALALALAGVALVVGPYTGRLLGAVRSAERERIRTEERAEMAAHLHDSVLQTLALMQRAADDPRRMVLLARRQERELRQWLYGGGPDALAEGSVAERADALAAEIELDHDVLVELVVVGDDPGNEALAALLGAVRGGVRERGPSLRHRRGGHLPRDRARRGRGLRAGQGLRLRARRGRRRQPWHHALHPRAAGTLRGPGAGGDDAGDRHGVGAGGATVERSGRRRPGCSSSTITPCSVRAYGRSSVRRSPSSVIAGDVDDAVTGIVASQPDVVLLDVHLPGGGGRAVVEAVRSRAPDVRFLALSVSDAAEDVSASSGAVPTAT